MTTRPTTDDDLPYGSLVTDAHHYHTVRNGYVCDYSVPPTPCFDADCPARPCSCYDPETGSERHTCGKAN